MLSAPRLNPGTPLRAIERRNLAIDPSPMQLAGKLHQFVLHVDDLIQPGAEQIARSRRLTLLRSHRVLRCDHRITSLDSTESQN
jgi:hypothetical protein